MKRLSDKTKADIGNGIKNIIASILTGLILTVFLYLCMYFGIFVGLFINALGGTGFIFTLVVSSMWLYFNKGKK